METKSNKSRNIWIAVGVVGALCLVACVVAYFVVRQVGSMVGEIINPEQAAAVGDKIAQYNAPPGFRTFMSLSIPGLYDVVMLSSMGDSSVIIMMMQFTGETDLSQEQMQEQVRQSFEQQSGQGGASMTVVETRQEPIRGEQVTISISEGESAGVKMRQLMTVFTGNGGPTVLMIQGAASDWDEQLILNFIHSIR